MMHSQKVIVNSFKYIGRKTRHVPPPYLNKVAGKDTRLITFCVAVNFCLHLQTQDIVSNSMLYDGRRDSLHQKKTKM